MPEDSSGRLTVSVGRGEFEDLTSAWLAYHEVAHAEIGSVDPVLAIRRAGSVLRSLERVLATFSTGPEKAEEDHSIE